MPPTPASPPSPPPPPPHTHTHTYTPTGEGQEHLCHQEGKEGARGRDPGASQVRLQFVRPPPSIILVSIVLPFPSLRPPPGNVLTRLYIASLLRRTLNPQNPKFETPDSLGFRATSNLEKDVAELQSREAAMKVAMKEMETDGEAKLESLRMQAAEEAHMAMDLLQKAENAAQNLGEQMTALTSEKKTTEEKIQERLKILEAENETLKRELEGQVASNQEITQKYSVSN